MNYSTLAIILDEKVRLVRCVFSDGGKEYLYKTLDNTIKVDDFVVVDYGIQLKDFKVVKVVEVDCVAELSEGIQYKWIVDKVELDKAKSTLKAEAKLIDKVRKEEIKVKRKQLKDAMGFGYLDSSIEMLMLESKTNDYTPAPTYDRVAKVVKEGPEEGDLSF